MRFLRLFRFARQTEWRKAWGWSSRGRAWIGVKGTVESGSKWCVMGFGGGRRLQMLHGEPPLSLQHGSQGRRWKGLDGRKKFLRTRKSLGCPPHCRVET